MDLIQNYGQSLLSLTAEMAPYLLLGFLTAGITHAFFPKDFIKRHLGGSGLMQSLKASLIGVPLPVCSCGVIPLAKELKKNGASNAGVASFLTSTPQTGVDSIVATAGLIGLPFAVIRVIVAFVSGILTGTIIGLLDRQPTKHQPVTESSNATARSSRSLKAILSYALIELPSDIRRSLTTGLLIAALITLLLPDVSSFTSDQPRWLTYLGISALAIPLYVCSTGSIPIAIALIASGLTPGAAVLFLVAGPATSIVTVITMISIIGWKNSIFFLISLNAMAWGAAFIVDSNWFGIELATSLSHIHDHGITPFQWICIAVFLTSMLADPLLRTYRKIQRSRVAVSESDNWQSVELEIEGMSCSKCAAKVTGILESSHHHRNIQVDLEQKRVSLEATRIESDQIRTKLEAAGYQLLDIR